MQLRALCAWMLHFCTAGVGAARAEEDSLTEINQKLTNAFRQRWNLQVIVAPVLPKLVRGNLFEPDSLEFGLGK